jgi:phage tail sheath gpL-like
MANFKELAQTPLTPFIGIETDFTAGSVVDPTSAKKCLLMGYQNGGLGLPNVVRRVTSLSEAIELYGKGSQLALMWEAASLISKQLPIYLLPYPEGGGAAKATGTVTITDGGGGSATGAGTLAVHIDSRLFRIGIQDGDTPTAIGDALEETINAHYNLPVTAVNVAGVVTKTAVNGGLGGNSIRFRAEVTQGININIATSGATLAGGATEGDPTTALLNIEQQRFHNGAFNSADATNVALVKTHIDTKSNARNQLWGQFSYPMVGTRSAGETLVNTAINNKRGQVPWLYGSEKSEFELAASFAAFRAYIVTRNYFLLDEILPGVVAPHDQTLWPNPAEIEAALENGLVPLRPRLDGQVEIVRNVIAVTPPPEFRDAELLEISDAQDEDIINALKQLARTNKALKVRSPAGTPGVLTPGKAQAVIHGRLRVHDRELDWIQGIDEDIKAGKVSVKPNATSPVRLDGAWPFVPVQAAVNQSYLKTYTLPNAA